MKKLAFVLAILFLLSVASVFAQALTWQAASSGSVPAFATPVGHTPDGKLLYLVRTGVWKRRPGVFYIRPGTSHTRIGYDDPSRRTSRLYGNQQAVSASSYDVYSGGDRWVSASVDRMPPNVISAGARADGTPVDILRVSYDGWVVPAYYSPADHAAVAYIDGKRLLFTTFQALEPAWVSAASPGAAGQAFRAATDSDGNPLVPLRSPHGGSIQLGKYNVGTHQGYISYGGRELVVDPASAKLFVGTGTWKPWSGRLPTGAIPAGLDDDGSILYVIRASVPGVSGAQSVGKFSDQRKQAYIPYAGKELTVTKFEILCYDLSAPGLSPSTLKPVQRTTPVVSPANPAVTPTSGETTTQSTPSIQEAPTTPTKIDSKYGRWRTSARLGPANLGKDGRYSAVYTYDGLSGEKVKITNSDSLTGPRGSVSFVLVSPDGTRSVAPASKSYGTVYAFDTPLSATGTYKIEIISSEPEDFAISLQGRGTMFTGAIDDQSRKAKDGTHYAPVEVTGLTPTFGGVGGIGAQYTLSLFAEAFEPTVTVVDKSTGKALKLTSVSQDSNHFSCEFVPIGKRVEIRVSPVAGTGTAGPFEATVTFNAVVGGK